MMNQSDYKARYRKWLLAPDEEFVRELLAIKDEKEIEDRFYEFLTFGTGGMRGIIGAGTNRMNIYTVRKATQGYAKYICSHGLKAQAQGIVIAYDNRVMSLEFAQNAAGVLSANGIRVYLFERLRPTPELSFAVRALGCFGGVMITASHNPPQYNGYKLYDAIGCQIVPHIVSKITKFIDEVNDEFHIPCAKISQGGTGIQFIGKEMDEKYIQKVKNLSICQVPKDGFKIVFSPQHGTANEPVRRVLCDLGYTVIPVKAQCSPDPFFTHTKNPNPESRESFILPLKEAKANDAHLVIVTDPDGDRLGIAVRHGHQYKRLTGNQTGAILLQYILEQKSKKGMLKTHSVMMNTIVTSDLGERIADYYHVRTEKTLTGFKYIGEKIQSLKQSHEEFVFGYEESCGYLIGDFVRDKDAMQAALLVSEAACYYHQIGKTLYDVLLDIYKVYGYYKDHLTSLSYPGKDGLKKINELLSKWRDNPPDQIDGIGVKVVEDYLCMPDDRKANVIKYHLNDGSFVAIRPSGTEPKCKIYYSVVAKSSREATRKLKNFRSIFEA